MQLVQSWDQVEKNIKILEAARVSMDDQLHKSYLLLIKRGTCFVVYQGPSGISFAPSKFIGYVNNDIKSHLKARLKRDGRDTNKAIKDILSQSPEPDQSAEALYVDFCRELNFEPSKTGTFGASRKFWLIDEVVEQVDNAAVVAIHNNPNLSQTEKEHLIMARCGQGLFRKKLISLWRKCCLTGCTELKLLRASHIKPWSKSDNHERLDKFNGLLLTPNADSLFDQGYITFSEDGDMIISKRLSKKAVRVLLACCDQKINIYEENRPYLKYHRKNRFLR